MSRLFLLKFDFLLAYFSFRFSVTFSSPKGRFGFLFLRFPGVQCSLPVVRLNSMWQTLGDRVVSKTRRQRVHFKQFRQDNSSQSKIPPQAPPQAITVDSDPTLPPSCSSSPGKVRNQRIGSRRQEGRSCQPTPPPRAALKRETSQF